MINATSYKMSKAMKIAVAVQFTILCLVLFNPLLVRATGTVVYLETEKMDPRSLFRGDFVILGYQLAQDILSEDMTQEAQELGKPVYVTISTTRPAEFVAVSFDKPNLTAGQACIVGRSRGVWQSRGNAVDFPQIAQFFVPEGEGRELEQARGDDLLAKVATSGGCNAVLLGLEMR
jgi:uncharacterized membrane-anchored protein